MLRLGVAGNDIIQQIISWPGQRTACLIEQLLCQWQVVHARVLHAHANKRHMEAWEESGRCPVGRHGLQHSISQSVDRAELFQAWTVSKLLKIGRAHV